MKRLKIEIPSGANEIIHSLQNNGYEAFLVGGCVRDRYSWQNNSRL